MNQEFDRQDHNTQPTRPRQESKAAAFGKTVLLYLHDVVYLLAVFLIVLLVFFRVVVVSGPSMRNTLLDGDNLIILTSTISGRAEYGDIVIVSKQAFQNGEPIVKRVIATENQWVDIDFIKGEVYIGPDLEHMELLQEDYIAGPTTRPEGVTFPVQVPEGCIFVLGDNRGNSLDSRSHSIGMIDEREVIGKAFFLVLPGTNGGTANRDFGRVGVLD